MHAAGQPYGMAGGPQPLNQQMVGMSLNPPGGPGPYTGPPPPGPPGGAPRYGPPQAYSNSPGAPPTSQFQQPGAPPASQYHQPGAPPTSQYHQPGAPPTSQHQQPGAPPTSQLGPPPTSQQSATPTSQYHQPGAPPTSQLGPPPTSQQSAPPTSQYQHSGAPPPTQFMSPGPPPGSGVTQYGPPGGYGQTQMQNTSAMAGPLPPPPSGPPVAANQPNTSHESGPPFMQQPPNGPGQFAPPMPPGQQPPGPTPFYGVQGAPPPTGQTGPPAGGQFQPPTGGQFKLGPGQMPPSSGGILMAPPGYGPAPMRGPPPMQPGGGMGPPPMQPGEGMGPPPLQPGGGMGPPPLQPGGGMGGPPPISGAAGPPIPGGAITGQPPLTQRMRAGPTAPGPHQVGGVAYPGGPPGPPGPGMAASPISQQPRTRIDPEQMPNPVAVMQLDQEQRGGTPFLTSTRGVAPPLVTTQFTVHDDGNCSPRYMRATTYTVPCSKDMVNSCRIPVGLIVQPLANIPKRENVLQLVDHGAGGPIRCNRCKAYMNPFVRFIDGGRQYICPVCLCSNEVPQEHFSHLDHQGRRTDTLQRPELCFGSIEYVATKDYCKEGRLPKPPAYIFMIDVSLRSVQCGLLDLLSQTMLNILDSLPGSSDPEGSQIQVGFVTYDRVLHFYNCKASLAQPQMMVLTDIADVFVPMVEGLLVSPVEARTVLESLLSQLPSMFAGSTNQQVILEPVVRAGMEALKAAGRNGRLFLFHTSLPSAPGPGMLKNRVDVKLLGTDKEKTLLSPVGSSYQKLVEECVKFGVSMELFLFPSAYCDVASLAGFVSATGGETHYYKNYQTSRDGDRFITDLKHSLSRETAFDCVMRVRASTGLRPTGFFGGFFMQNTTDIEFGNIDADKAIAVEIKHDDKLKEEDIAFFQAALLYTDCRGQRRLRVHNLALSCSTKFQDIYRSCEIDTVINFFSKSIIKASLSMSYKSIRETFSNQCAVILAGYRKHCSNQSPPGQLILPESLKLLPMYANCLLKSDVMLSPPIVSLDEKCWLIHSLLSSNLKQTIAYYYPRLVSLHDVSVEGKALPPVRRCTGQKLQENGVYVIENGFQMVVWVGQQASVEFLTQVFGVGSHSQISTELPSLPALDNPLSFRVRSILGQLQAPRQVCMPFFVSKQRDGSEVLFRRMLKEDKGAGQWEGTSYIDFLCQVHRDIKGLLT